MNSTSVQMMHLYYNTKNQVQLNSICTLGICICWDSSFTGSKHMTKISPFARILIEKSSSFTGIQVLLEGNVLLFWYFFLNSWKRLHEPETSVDWMDWVCFFFNGLKLQTPADKQVQSHLDECSTTCQTKLCDGQIQDSIQTIHPV